jgi:hypothetical protein
MITLDERTTRSLRHVLLKARNPVVGTEGDYEKAYGFWLEMWRSTFSEVDPDIELHSDTFVTQREVSAIFLRDQVIALMMYDFRDLSLRAHRDLSSFKYYPAEVLDVLQHDVKGPVMMAGQFTVHPDFRRGQGGPFMSELLAGIALKRFLGSTTQVMIAFTRNDRGMQDLCYRYGAVPLRKGLSAHGIPSDVIAFYRDRIIDSAVPGMAEHVDRLWYGTNVARLFSDLPPALRREPAENDMVVLMNEAMRGR